MKFYRVGGAVRDLLLGRPVKDVDWVVVGATAEEMLEQGFKPVGGSFPVFLHPETNEEYALARTERKVGPGYRGFSFQADPGVSLEDDLRRRDLTVNAMAMDEDQRLIDPFGGRRDLEAGILRHVSEAFVEDPVRILRTARFAARFDFALAPETALLLEDIVAAGEADHLVAERVWQELRRALDEPHPERFFAILHECGALAVVMPELEQAYADATIAPALAALKHAAGRSSPSEVRFAALTHALRATPADDLAGVEALCDRLRAPNSYRELAALAARYCPDTAESALTDPPRILALLKASDALRRPARFADLLDVCHAGAVGRGSGDPDGYPPGVVLMHALSAAAGVEAQPYVAAGLSGPELAEALDEARLEAIEKALAGE